MKRTYNYIIILSFLCSIGCVSACLPSREPKVRISSGEIAGGHTFTYNGRKLYSFLGIPYARPPVQNYRFKEPQSVKPWIGVWNATTPGSPCLGPDNTNYPNIIGQEDCLYLNVYTPKLPQGKTSRELMSVVVFIHGGAFVWGQGITYGPEYLLGNNNFVYVSINYRLGVLGFASTGDKVLPGNNGMKDQVAALKWIQQNIRAFGGDPDSVTLTGLSAGANSVHYHLLSPMSKGLFHRAILQSGSAFCHWAYAENVAQKTKAVAKTLGCPTSNSRDIIECLRTKPGEAITKSIFNFMPWRFNPFSPFGPTVDSAGEQPFLPDIPEKLVPDDIPVLMSKTKYEGLVLAVFVLVEDAMNELNNNWNDHIPHLLDYNYTVSNESLRTQIAHDIKRFYFGDQIVSMNTKTNLVKMLSDRTFGYAISKAAQNIASKNTAPVYFHEFGYSGEYSILTDFPGVVYSQGSDVTHCDETYYVLKVQNKSPHANEKDKKMVEKMVNIWASFIENGIPNIEDTEVSWLPVSKNPSDPFRYLKITQNQTFNVTEESNHGNYVFWKNLPLTEFYETNNMLGDDNNTQGRPKAGAYGSHVSDPTPRTPRLGSVPSHFKNHDHFLYQRFLNL